MTADDEGVLLAAITVTKTMYDDDVIIDIPVYEPDDLAVSDAVGMLAFAQHTLLTVPLMDNEEDE